MVSKIKIECGRLTLEFEGSEDFIKNDLVKLITEIREASATMEGLSTAVQSNQDVSADSLAAPTPQLGMNSVAQKLAVGTGPDLTLAAAVKLTFIDQKTKFTSRDLTSEMRKAVSYFKENYAKNLGSNLSSLVKAGKLNDVGSGFYSIPAVFSAALAEKIK